MKPLNIFFSLALLLSGCSLENFPFGSDNPYAESVREVSYVGVETPIYLAPNEQTIVSFPTDIINEFWKGSSVDKNTYKNQLTLFSWDEIPQEGEQLNVVLHNGANYLIWILPSTSSHQPDKAVKIIDLRPPAQIIKDKENRWIGNY